MLGTHTSVYGTETMTVPPNSIRQSETPTPTPLVFSVLNLSIKAQQLEHKTLHCVVDAVPVFSMLLSPFSPSRSASPRTKCS